VGLSLQWFKSYLTQRFQQVLLEDQNFNKFYSEWKEIKYGVPQGSILGPTLFLIYINYLPDFMENEMVIFVDDTTYFIQSPDLDMLKTMAKNLFQKMINWFESNGLNFNCTKTNLI